MESLRSSRKFNLQTQSAEEFSVKDQSQLMKRHQMADKLATEEVVVVDMKMNTDNMAKNLDKIAVDFPLVDPIASVYLMNFEN